MFKNLLKLFGIISVSGTAVFQTADIVKVNNNVSVTNYNENKNDITSIDLFASTSYKDLIAPTENSLMYLGRVLKYYIANMVDVSSDTISSLESYISNLRDVSGATISADDKNLLLQNLFASTINISLYGASSDQEFFAEAFNKWMLTPDEIKNRSWEILNTFFVEALPQIVSEGGRFETQASRIQGIVEQVVQENNSTKYRIGLETADANKVSLRYKNNQDKWLFSSNNATSALQYLLSQQNLLTETNVTYINKNRTTFDELVNGQWMNDSLTPASEEAISNFNQANAKHFASLGLLDSTLAQSSKDPNGVSLINISGSIDAIESTYMNESPTDTSSNDYDVWTTETSTAFKETLLVMYNYLWNYVSNDEVVLQNISSALIFAADKVLVDADDSTMGTTITYSLSDGSSTVESFVVILGSALTFAEYNSQYTNGFWASPAKFAVVVHEFGHVLDAFAGKVLQYRSIFNPTNKKISEKYSGLIFGYNKLGAESSGSTILYVFGTLVGISIIGGAVTIIIVSTSKKRKKN